MAVRMELSRIFIREHDEMQFIELTEKDGTRSFPIVVGKPEAMAIARRFHHESIPRPQTHELLDSAIAALGGRVERVVIHDLADGTFFAKLILVRAGREIEIDCRPSDAIALGVAEATPIFVEEKVLENAVDNAEIKAEGEAADDDDDDDAEEGEGESEGEWGGEESPEEEDEPD